MFVVELVFRKPKITDKEKIQKILEKEKNIHSESAFGTWFLWSEPLNIEFCELKNILFKKVGKNDVVFEFPRGVSSIKELREAILILVDYAQKNKLKEFKFTELLGSEVVKLQKAFPEKFKITANRDKYEYIYKTKDLALLQGRKYHSKKNHISKFSKMYDWEYKPLNYDEKEKYLKFTKLWFEKKYTPEKIKSLKEYDAMKKAIENINQLALQGGIIKVNGKIVALTIGEKINEKNFLIHFEKVLPEYIGAYSVINREFAKTLLNKFEFINREEDMGIAGLRKSKLSYKPFALLPKYDALLIDYQN